MEQGPGVILNYIQCHIQSQTNNELTLLTSIVCITKASYYLILLCHRHSLLFKNYYINALHWVTCPFIMKRLVTLHVQKCLLNTNSDDIFSLRRVVKCVHRNMVLFTSSLACFATNHNLLTLYLSLYNTAQSQTALLQLQLLVAFNCLLASHLRHLFLSTYRNTDADTCLSVLELPESHNTFSNPNFHIYSLHMKIMLLQHSSTKTNKQTIGQINITEINTIGL